MFRENILTGKKLYSFSLSKENGHFVITFKSFSVTLFFFFLFTQLILIRIIITLVQIMLLFKFVWQSITKKSH